MKYLVVLLILTACGKKETVSVYNGKDGANGHSLVSQYVEAEECLAGGTRLDIVLDVDDNLIVSEGDLFQSSLIACNGEQGLQGIAGADGEDGEDGEDGKRGLIGPRGLRGRTGAVGPQGIQGPNGEQGEPGPTGEEGPQGIQGIQGEAGLNASSCTLVFKPNQGHNGRKYTLTCGLTSITFTADSN